MSRWMKCFSFSRIGLLPRILIAIALGVALGNLLPLPVIRIFATFNDLFGGFISFMVPLIIVGLVTPAIASVGRGVGFLLVLTLIISYADTVVSALLGYGTGMWLFPDMVSQTAGMMNDLGAAAEINPYFSIEMPPMLDVTSALIVSFVIGIGIAYLKTATLQSGVQEFSLIIQLVITKAIIPLLPIYICGIFTNMTFSGQAYGIMLVFIQVIAVIFVLHISILFYEFCLAALVVHRNPFQMLFTMLPAYFTALGTSSSVATIPVTLDRTLKNGVSKSIAGFVIPICATIHLSGSVMKLTCCSLAICMIQGIPHDFGLFFYFILMLSIMMVAAPGVPGGAVMAALAPLSSILGFGENEQALMIALYIAMDSFGTACNVTGDGAIALVIDKWKSKDGKNYEDGTIPQGV